MVINVKSAKGYSVYPVHGNLVRIVQPHSATTTEEDTITPFQYYSNSEDENP